MQLYEKSISELEKLLRDKSFSAVELTEYFLERIEHEDGRVGAYITLCGEKALEQAKKADERISQGKVASVTGVPISVKDNICTAGIRTTCASKMLENFVPSYNATAVERLLNEEAVILGKVNMDEFAVGATGELSALRVTANPLNHDYLPGGSSSGSAASVAAGMCAGSICSDTGGSVRVPASACGLVGFKPSYGAISRFGLVAHASSFDQIGVIARSVSDAGLLSSVMYGADARDISVREVEKPTVEACSLSDITFAFSDVFLKTSDISVAKTVTEVKGLMCSAGAVCTEAKISMYDSMTNIYRIIASAELASNLARFDGIKYGYSHPYAENVTVGSRSASLGREVKKRIVIGNYVLSEENFTETYEKACGAREKVCYEFENVFKGADVVLAPVCDSVAARRGEAVYDGGESYRSDIHTVAANLAGLPAVSIPAGRDSNGMPISIQLMAQRFNDKKLLSVAAALEALLKEV